MPRTNKIAVHVEPMIEQKLQELAMSKNMSFSSYVRRILFDYLNDRDLLTHEEFMAIIRGKADDA